MPDPSLRIAVDPSESSAAIPPGQFWPELLDRLGSIADRLATITDRADGSRQPAPMLLDAETLARVLGGVGARTVHTWYAEGRLPEKIRISKSVFWRADEIRSWVLAGTPLRRDWEQMQRVKKG